MWGAAVDIFQLGVDLLSCLTETRIPLKSSGVGLHHSPCEIFAAGFPKIMDSWIIVITAGRRICGSDGPTSRDRWATGRWIGCSAASCPWAIAALKWLKLSVVDADTSMDAFGAAANVKHYAADGWLAGSVVRYLNLELPINRSCWLEWVLLAHRLGLVLAMADGGRLDLELKLLAS
ncbi:hypothetical protein ACLOJK_022618 [Asimina triloba]